MPHFYGKLDDVFYFHFAANDTSGSGDDGASPLADVRLGGAAQGAAPVHSPTPILLTNAGFTAGLHEIAITASAGNGYANGTPNHYAVFCSLAVDAQNPSGFVGSFELSANGGLALRGSDDDNLKDLSDQIDAIPTTAMRGTNSAALASVCTESRLSELDAANLPSDVDAILAAARVLSVRKNTLINNFTFTMRDSNGDPVSGSTVTAQKILDSASVTSMTNTPAEVGGSGVYRFNVSADDVNADFGCFILSGTGGAKTRTIHFQTVP